jgi:hypothetical protein
MCLTPCFERFAASQGEEREIADRDVISPCKTTNKFRGIPAYIVLLGANVAIRKPATPIGCAPACVQKPSASPADPEAVTLTVPETVQVGLPALTPSLTVPETMEAVAWESVLNCPTLNFGAATAPQVSHCRSATEDLDAGQQKRRRI